MALSLSSPSGCPYDEDEELAVFESTAAEHGVLARPRLPEISVISPGLDSRPSITQPVSLQSCNYSTHVVFSHFISSCQHSCPNVCISIQPLVSIQHHDTKVFLISRDWQLNLRWWHMVAAMMGTQRELRSFCASDLLLRLRMPREKNRCDYEANTDMSFVFFFCFCCQTCAFMTFSAVVPWAQGLPVFQGCVAVQNEETLLLKAPKESQNMRTAERGITQSMHKFSFSKVGDSSWCIISINLYLLWTCMILGHNH